MKFIKTLLLLIIITDLSAQNKAELSINRHRPKVLWDIGLGPVFLKQEDVLVGGTLQLSVRLKNKLYLNASYFEVIEFLPNIIIPFGTSIGTANDKAPYVKNLSIVAGTFFNIDIFNIALALGPTHTKGYNFVDSKYRDFNIVGLDLKVQLNLNIVSAMGLGLSYNYNVNKVKNFQYLTAVWCFGKLQ